MRARSAILYSVLTFALFWTLVALSFAIFGSTGLNTQGAINGLHTEASPFFRYSIPLAGAGWIAVGLVYFEGRVGGNKRSQVKSLFARMGFESDVYDLMIGMRGAGSRVSLLQNMQSPKHRLELSELTGIDWKEVDRQLSVLEKYGLVKVHAQSGTVKLYKVTEQGKLLLNLVSELNK